MRVIANWKRLKYHVKGILRLPLVQNSSMSFSIVSSNFRTSSRSRVSRAKDVRLSSFIELLSQVFSRRRVENERSYSDEDIFKSFRKLDQNNRMYNCTPRDGRQSKRLYSIHLIPRSLKAPLLLTKRPSRDRMPHQPQQTT